ncbi:MAG: ABC transporter permease [Acidimicrobiaceae bacterium]|nr:ABC transporter permease [Acidimicrobiaceae bacterium]
MAVAAPSSSEPAFSDRAASGSALIGSIAAPVATGTRRFRPVFWACIIWIGLVVLVALTVQWLPIHSPVGVIGIPNTNPNFSHELLGTDAIGRSMDSRLAYGARTSMEISVLATVIPLFIGVVLGLLSTYYGGVVTVITDIIGNSILSIPGLLFLLAIVVAMGSGKPVLIGAISILFIPAYMRLSRASAMSQMEREYVTAARAMGASSWRILARELLPNTLPSLLTYALVVLPAVIIIEGTLSFLGFGVQPPTPSWGQMIAQGEQYMTTSPWQAFIPCLVLFFTVFSLNTLGDHFRAKIDVRGAT